MTTINNIHALVELLQNNPDWAETNRSLTRVDTSQKLLHGRLEQHTSQDYEKEADRLATWLLDMDMDMDMGANNTVTLQRGWAAPHPRCATVQVTDPNAVRRRCYNKDTLNP